MDPIQLPVPRRGTKSRISGSTDDWQQEDAEFTIYGLYVHGLWWYKRRYRHSTYKRRYRHRLAAFTKILWHMISCHMWMWCVAMWNRDSYILHIVSCITSYLFELVNIACTAKKIRSTVQWNHKKKFCYGVSGVPEVFFNLGRWFLLCY
jgi:hypothetical protein